MVKIIKLNKRHIEQLAKIDLESEHELDKRRQAKLSDFKKELNRRFSQGHEMFFGYKEDGVLKGYVTLKPFFPGHKHCEVYWLAVNKKYQGKGIGTKLMRFIENYAKKKGFRKACAYTNKIMKKTRKFYEKLRYKLVNEFPGYYGYPKNNTAVLYAKRL